MVLVLCLPADELEATQQTLQPVEVVLEGPVLEEHGALLLTVAEVHQSWAGQLAQLQTAFVVCHPHAQSVAWVAEESRQTTAWAVQDESAALIAALMTAEAQCSLAAGLTPRHCLGLLGACQPCHLCLGLAAAVVAPAVQLSSFWLLPSSGSSPWCLS